MISSLSTFLQMTCCINGWVILHREHTLHFLYLLICWGTPRLKMLNRFFHILIAHLYFRNLSVQFICPFIDWIACSWGHFFKIILFIYLVCRCVYLGVSACTCVGTRYAPMHMQRAEDWCPPLSLTTNSFVSLGQGLPLHLRLGFSKLGQKSASPRGPSVF